MGLPKGNLDLGAVIGSYIGLFLLGSSFTAIGICSSLLTKNQVVAFVIGVFLCFFTYSGLGSLSKMFELNQIGVLLQYAGIDQHYQSMSRGVIDTRDLVYFFTFVVFFLSLSRWFLGGRKW
ncbi:gliding motility-associated ABC transporter permease protein GldF [compost metagenome]